MPGDGCRHDPDRPGAGDQNIFSENIERESRVNGIAERIEDRGGVAVHARIVPPDIRHRQSDEFCETSRPVHADARRVRTKMPSSGHAVAASAADDVSFTGDQFAGMKVIDIGSDFNDLAHKLMADRPSESGIVCCAHSFQSKM